MLEYETNSISTWIGGYYYILTLASGSGKNTNIRQSMLTLTTHSGFHDLFLELLNVFYRTDVFLSHVKEMEKSVTFAGACANEIMPNG
jgi:hypothetical protein